MQMTCNDMMVRDESTMQAEEYMRIIGSVGQVRAHPKKTMQEEPQSGKGRCWTSLELVPRGMEKTATLRRISKNHKNRVCMSYFESLYAITVYMFYLKV